MPYDSIQLLYGILLDRIRLISLFKKRLAIHNNVITVTEPYLNYGMYIFSFPCCSPLNQRYWIVGQILDKCYRYYPDQCVEIEEKNSDKGCDKNSPCIKCLSCTVNGIYDIEKIFHSLVIPDQKDICFSCFYDNNRPRPDDDEKMVEDHMGKKLKDKPCYHCNNKMTNRSYPERKEFSKKIIDIDMVLTREFDQIENSDNEYPRNFYYRLDGCIYC